MNNKTLTVGLLILSLLIAALIFRSGDLLWMTLPFLAYLGLGLLQTPPQETLQLSARRTLVETRSGGSFSVAMNLTIENQSAEMVDLFALETVQAGMKIIDGELSGWASLRPGETLDLNYVFQASRGNFTWKTARVVVSDALGLLETELQLPASAALQVRPRIKKFKAIALRPRSTLHSPGSIPARLGGSGTDFFGVREYHPGDPLRSLDWRLTARHPRKFYTKEFEQEEIAEIGLILDARLVTDLQLGDESLFEASVTATASLAEMFLHQGHRVSLLVFAKAMLNVFPGYGKQQLYRILSCLSKAKIEPENRAFASLDFIPTRIFPSQALIILFSSLISSDRSFFLRLRAAGYQVLLISPDPISFVAPTLPEDASTRFAMRAARLERRLRLKEIAQLQVRVIDWQISEPLFPLVRNALTRSRGQRE
jgi:uncharacterized protein (DUF58 family)